MATVDPRFLRSRQAMLGAATLLLLRGGVTAVTHQAVAEEAGVSLATVYRHWPKLTALLLDALADVGPNVHFGDGDLRTQLVHEFGSQLSAINSAVTPAVISVLVGRGDHDEQAHDLRQRIFGRLVDATADVIAAASRKGELVADAPARELALMMLGALLLERAMLGFEVTSQRLERVVDGALEGWRPSPRRPRS